MRVPLTEELRRRSDEEAKAGNKESARLLWAAAAAIEELQGGLDDVINCCRRVRNQEISKGDES